MHKQLLPETWLFQQSEMFDDNLWVTIFHLQPLPALPGSPLKPCHKTVAKFQLSGGHGQG